MGVSNRVKKAALDAYISGKDIRCRLLMANTTCDTEYADAADLADYTTIDPCDATGYADVALAGESTSQDDVNDRAEFDANDVSFAGLGGDGTRNYVGVLLYEYVDGTNANDLSVGYVAFTTPIPATATQVDVPWDAEGIVRFTEPA